MLLLNVALLLQPAAVVSCVRSNTLFHRLVLCLFYVCFMCVLCVFYALFAMQGHR